MEGRQIGELERQRAWAVEFLEGRGWGAEAARFVEDVAEVGMRLDRGGSGERSRLGGPALLPSRAAWPSAGAGRPLSFLAGLDLRELPRVGPLPDAGWLMFYADLDNDNADGLIDSAANTEGSKARVFFVAAGVEPVDAVPPSTLRDVLRPCPVRAVAQITVPDDYEVAQRLALDPDRAQAYDELSNRLRWGDEGWSPGATDHWVLGAWSGVQGHPIEPGTVLVLQIASDQAIDFEFLDAGLIQFRIPTDSLQAGRWEDVIAEADTA